MMTTYTPGDTVDITIRGAKVAAVRAAALDICHGAFIDAFAVRVDAEYLAVTITPHRAAAPHIADTDRVAGLAAEVARLREEAAERQAVIDKLADERHAARARVAELEATNIALAGDVATLADVLEELEHRHDVTCRITGETVAEES